jgi:hypothetical protein
VLDLSSIDSYSKCFSYLILGKKKEDNGEVFDKEIHTCSALQMSTPLLVNTTTKSLNENAAAAVQR